MVKGNAVLSYVESTINIFFETDHVACDYCPLLETYARKQCRRTGEYIIDSRTIGYNCPLNFIIEKENTHEAD